MTPDSSGVSRRTVLTGAGVTGVAAAAGIAGLKISADTHSGGSATPAAAPVAPHGRHQSGVSRPEVPQQHCLLSVLDFAVDDDAAATLRSLGENISLLTDPHGGLSDLTPDGPGDLSITIGVGARILQSTADASLADRVSLPLFAGDDEIDPDHIGGDLLLSVHSTDPTILEPVTAWLIDAIPGAHLKWSDHGFRAAPIDGVARNPLGYLDGIIGPRGETELSESVWISSGALAGGTIAVIRRLRLDTDAFRDLSPAERDAVIGREQQSGSPLSGGDRDADIDLRAKSPDGQYLVPLTAHARAAHPAFTGSPLMLRRSYGYRADAHDHGQLFVSFQNDVATFVNTQLRLDETDALMGFATPTASAAFAILPGFDRSTPLGTSLYS